VLRKGHILAILVIGVSVTTFLSISAQQNYDIPAWVKGIAGFWSEDKISDNDFGEGLSFLIQQGIIKIPEMESLKQEVAELKVKVNELEQENSILKGQGIVETVPEPTSTQHIITIKSGASHIECVDTHSCVDQPKLTIKVGDTVIWKNEDAISHFLSSGTPSYGPTDLFMLTLNPGESFEFTYDTPGSYDFFSITSPWVSGEIVVNLN